MTRKDSEKDSERPHYYSQFWLDVAAGRRIIGTPKTNEETELAEPETPEPILQRRTSRPSVQESNHDDTAVDGRAQHVMHPVAEPVTAPDEYIEPEEVEEEEPLVANEVEDLDYQEAPLEDADIPDMDLSPADEEEEESFDEEEEGEGEEEEEEDDDDMSWGRGRKKAKPVRQPIKPAPKRSSRRDLRRGF